MRSSNRLQRSEQLLAQNGPAKSQRYAQQQPPRLFQGQQQLVQNEPAQPAPPPQPQPQVQPAPQPTVPSDDVLLLLIRSTLIALNQANVTGNYSVLRDLAAPSFREANSLEKLTQIFARMRQRNLDLAPILLIQPKLYRKAEITPKGMLRITGFFEIDPERVNFDLLYQPVQGRWRLFGISANASEPRQPPTSLPIEAEPSEAAPPAKSTAAPASTPEKPNPPEAGGGAPKSPPKTEIDVRDRLDNPPSPPPEDEEPKEKSFWNPFAR